MIDSLRPFLSRALAPFITMGLGWLVVHLGLDFGADAAGHITEYAVVVLVTLFTALNGVVHRVIDKKFNPADAASKPIAVAGKIESEKGP